MAKHEIDVTSMVFGTLFVGAAGVWALVEGDVVSWPDASRIFPILLVVAGLLGLASTLRRGMGDRGGAAQPVETFRTAETTDTAEHNDPTERRPDA